MTNELILLGKGESAGLVDDYWRRAVRPELWTLNDVVDARAEWHYDIHEDQRFAGCYDEIRRAGWMVSPFAAWAKLEPRMGRFPLREVHLTFGVSYYECTLDYMLAMALLMQRRRQKRWTRIHLPGFDMSDGRHYTFRPGASFWLGVARGMQVPVNIPRSSTLLRRVVDHAPQAHGDPEFPHAYGQSAESTTKVAEQYGWRV